MGLTVGELNATINLDNSGFNRKVDESERKFRGFGSSVQSMASRIAPAAAAVGLSFGAVAAGIGAISLKAVGASANMEQTRIAFTTMLGDAKKADTFIRSLQKFAAATPFEFVGLTENAKRLMAMGFAAKDVIPTLTNVGDAVAALGSGAAGLDAITYALGQMRTSGKVHTQDMMQLTNAGVAGWQMLADKLHTTVQGAQEMVQKGEVSSVTGLDAIMAGMHSRYGGLMAKQSHTVLGLFSNLQDIVNQSLVKMGDKIVQTFDLKGKLAGATQFIQAFMAGLDKGGLMGGLGAIFDTIGISADAYAPALESVGNAIKAIGKAIQGAASIVSGVVTGAASIIFGSDGLGFWENMDGALVVVAGVVGGILTAAFAALAVTVIAATWPLLAIGAAVGLLALGAYELWKHWGDVMKVLEPFTSIVGPALKGLWEAIQPAIAKIRKDLGPMGQEFGAAFKEWEPILKAIGTAILKNLGGELAFVINILKAVLPPAIDIALGFIHVLAKALDGVAAILRGDWGKAWNDAKDIVKTVLGGLSKIHIPLPHFSMHGGFNPADWAQGKNLPGLNVSWYDRGGLFRGPQVIGVGERRPEMVGALDDVFPLMVRAFREAQAYNAAQPGDSREVVTAIERQTKDLIDGMGPGRTRHRGI